jgi:signal transduction histidine kinase
VWGSYARCMLEIRDLGVSFAGAPLALDGVDLDVRAGEIVALSGEPGSGKSALTRCVAGDLLPSSGTISVDGHLLSSRSRNPDRYGVAVVWQNLALCDTLDVAANLMLGREMNLSSDARFHAAAAQELAALGIPIRDPQALVSTLTLGQRWLLALAMALGRRPKVLIVDELTTSLGVLANATVERLLLAAQAQGTAILLITRDIEQMFRIADRIVVLAHGGVAGEFDPQSSHRDDVAALLGEEAAIAHREAAALRRSQELQRQFLGRLSHELRTPLTAIRGYATSLAAPDVTWDDDSQQRFLERIAAESARLGRLVDDLLDFSAIESGVMRLQPDWCDLRLVIEAAVALLPTDWSASVSVCCDADVPVIWADHDRLEQVFVNLLTNAFKHNRPGISVTLEGHQGDENLVEITVSDDGDGFPGELRDNPFDSAQRSRSRTAGAGLGLSISKGIVEAHGGTITLATPERGTRFEIVLPVEVAGAAEEPSVARTVIGAPTDAGAALGSAGLVDLGLGAHA